MIEKTYQLVITERRPNPTYSPHMSQWTPEYLEKVLDVTVTEEQFNAIRAAVLEKAFR